MDIERQKAAQFIQRLLANPTLHDFSPIHREDQIIQFLKINERQLMPTLSSADYFTNHSWTQIEAILTQALRETTDKSLIAQTKILLDRIDFTFTAFLREQGVPVLKAGEPIFDFQKKLLQKTEARKAFIGPFQAVLNGITDRYVDEAFRRRDYIHFELTKVQKLKMSKEEIKNLIKVSLILRNSIHLLTVESAGRGMMSGVIQTAFAEKVLQILEDKIKILPDRVLRSCVNSNVSFLENSSIEATSRITSIFAFRCQNYVPTRRLDRGADSPDKSWFSIARRNYKYYGFDIKMLDELYKTAGENGW
jgi:hypothetical protein